MNRIYAHLHVVDSWNLDMFTKVRASSGTLGAGGGAPLQPWAPPLAGVLCFVFVFACACTCLCLCVWQLYWKAETSVHILQELHEHQILTTKSMTTLSQQDGV